MASFISRIQSNSFRREIWKKKIALSLQPNVQYWWSFWTVEAVNKKKTPAADDSDRLTRQNLDREPEQEPVGEKAQKFAVPVLHVRLK